MKTLVTLEFRDNKVMIPYQEDAQNIATDTDQDYRDIYFSSIKLGGHLYLKWSDTDRAWIILSKVGEE